MGDIVVPEFAVANARHGLELRKEFPDSEKPSLSPQEAKEKGVHSGVTTAQTLIRSDMISEGMAERIKGFLSRTKSSSYSEREDVARLIWGEYEGDDPVESERTFLEYLEDKLDQV